MHYVLVIYPRVDEALVGTIRRKYDPTVDVIAPHLPVVYPVPESIGLDRLSSHIGSVAADTPPFDIRLGRLNRSSDHWLFLTPARGAEDLTQLYWRLHTGVLAEFRAVDGPFVPHVALGHLLRPGATYDWEHPREEDFDTSRYEVAFREAQPLLASSPQRVDTVHLVAVPDEVLEWSGGERAALPRGLRVTDVRTFLLGD